MASSSTTTTLLLSQAQTTSEKPSFLTPKINGPVLMKENGFQLDATLWCNAIRRLTADQVGIEDPVVLAKFKAALVLEVYDVFVQKEKTYAALRAPFIALETQKNALMKVSLGFAWLGGEELTDTYLEKEQKEYADVVANLCVVYEKLFSPADSGLAPGSSTSFLEYYNDKKRLEVKEYLGKTDIYEKKSLINSKKVYESIMHTALVATKQKLGSGIFNVDYLEKQQTAIAAIPEEYNKLPSALKTDVVNLVMECQLNNAKLLSDHLVLISHMPRIVETPGFNFVEHYVKALEALDSNKKMYLVNSIIEKMLQQEYQPTAKQKTVSDTMSYLAKYGNSAVEQLKKLEIVEKLKALKGDIYPLHVVLRQASDIVALPNEIFVDNPDVFAAWRPVGGRAPMDTSSEVLTETAIDRLIEELPFQAEYHDAFKGYSTGTVYTSNDMFDRDEAQAAFRRRLGSTTSLVQISALFTVAHDYINRPEPGSISSILGKTHRYTWRSCMDLARAKAFALLKENAADMTLSELRLWKNTPLFSEHKGDVTNVGETDTQRAIEKIIIEKEKSLKSDNVELSVKKININ